MKIWNIFIGILLFWLLVFAISIIPNERQVSAPDQYPRVILKTRPVDPRDLLRGDYVILSYDFSQARFLSNESLNNQLELILKNHPSGTDVFVTLDVNPDGHAKTRDILLERPGDGLFLAGKVRGRKWNKELRFGIEKYFVPAGKGKELERARNADNLSAVIAIDPETGKGLVVDLLVGEESVDFSEIEPTPPSPW